MTLQELVQRRWTTPWDRAPVIVLGAEGEARLHTPPENWLEWIRFQADTADLVRTSGIRSREVLDAAATDGVSKATAERFGLRPPALRARLWTMIDNARRHYAIVGHFRGAPH